jgi:hypothetical protein
LRHAIAAVLLVASGCISLQAQGNYEIQVYGSDLVAPGATMFELHSNFTVSGTTGVVDGVLPTNHAEHETLEITHGWNSFFETGFYQFTSIQSDGSWMWVGTHIRPRVSAPEDWHWPVGVSLSLEFGYQRPNFSQDTWTLEIRPIIDKKLGKWYLDFNPSMDRSFHGPSVSQGVTWSPNVKVSYDVTKRIAFGFEYYANYGSLTGFDPLRDQMQSIYPAVDVDFGPNWEFNFGVGVGMTQATDHLLVKAILGYRVQRKKKSDN